jgi:hypothetical protein
MLPRTGAAAAAAACASMYLNSPKLLPGIGAADAYSTINSSIPELLPMTGASASGGTTLLRYCCIGIGAAALVSTFVL